jgi:hypothetical protein
MSQSRYPEWEESYRDAVLELDPKNLAQRIATAEAALAARLRLIEDESNNMAERIAIGNALSALKVLKPVNA